MTAFVTLLTPRIAVPRRGPRPAFSRSRAPSFAAPTTRASLAPAATSLRQHIDELAGPSRGIFGLPDEDRLALASSVEAVENENPTAIPTADNAAAAAGDWRLLYTTLQILGRRRVRLAIATPRKPGLVQLGDVVQTVRPDTGLTQNIVHFSALGTSGTFTVDARYQIASDARVAVTMTGTQLRPQALEDILGENQALLTQIFNPEGHLDITYVDDSLRIGRDHKGRIFVLEKIMEHSS